MGVKIEHATGAVLKASKPAISSDAAKLAAVSKPTAPAVALPKRACLGGVDVVKLLKGEVVSAYGVEFVYDGTDAIAIQQASEDLGNKSLTHARKKVS